MPCSPAQRAERRLPPPYQRRSRRPGERGCTRSEKTSMPWVPLKRDAGPPATRSSRRLTRPYPKSSASAVSG
ncbi:hypothetical protein M2169_005190 [Streptomyces sp. MJP52]|nr:hypothetical protein [Streptomyces sp. MJP52]